MSKEFNPNPWRHTREYVDRTYPSGVAGARPKLTTRIHCGVDDPPSDDPELDMAREEARLRREREAVEVSGSSLESRVELFNRQLREGHGGRNAGDE